MFEQIMVPLDGSELAERALPSAARLARLSTATLHLVRVVDMLMGAAWSPAPAYIPADWYETEAREAAAYLEAQRLRLEAEDVTACAVPLTGQVAPTLLDYERQTPIDLVVMCSHGRGGLARFALGSVAERLLHYGTAPLLLVRAFGPPISPDQPGLLARVVVPLDGSERAEQALAIAESLAASTEREIVLVQVTEHSQQHAAADLYLAETARRLEQRGLACQRRVEEGDPAERIVAASGPQDLIVMATHGRMGLARWALGSVADRVARVATGEVLLVRSGQAGTEAAAG